MQSADWQAHDDHTKDAASADDPKGATANQPIAARTRQREAKHRVCNRRPAQRTQDPKSPIVSLVSLRRRPHGRGGKDDGRPGTTAQAPAARCREIHRSAIRIK
ncbi:hypothetical protein CATMQ487_36140 [Sphaerotilus microaerophilus]|uniref:Uncharacterized protein n=1 Tax=Sphaerotilus microaerophilus TaxID=2914710 RepID=A0ABN6PN71_9BURK|nr:hypothetical protein CATMQ487_36140 [Sphaerotilus sp. FB-5]